MSANAVYPQGSGTRWVSAKISTAMVYEKSDTQSAHIGSVYGKEQLTYLGEKIGNRAFVEFNAPAGRSKRGYMDASLLVESMNGFSSSVPGLAYTKNQTIPNWLPYGGGGCAQGFNDLTSNLKGHFGYDISAPGGVIKPLFEGEFVSSVPNIGNANGRTVTLRHNINGEVFFTTYSHLASVERFSQGQRVFPTTALGMMGGSAKTEHDFAPHLHLCLYLGPAQNNPYGYCDASHSKTFQQTVRAGGATHGWYYGADERIYPHCGNVRFYDPYRVYTTAAMLIKATRGQP